MPKGFDVKAWESLQAMLAFKQKAQAILENGFIVVKDCYIEWKPKRGKRKGRFVVHLETEMD